jgi:serine/threonine protein kinase
MKDSLKSSQSIHTINYKLDLSQKGYRINRKLGQNLIEGRVTYLATHLKTKKPVVIKEFQFSQKQSSWSTYQVIEREIQALRSLSHPSIPGYLDSFMTETGFYLVQEYKPAPSLSISKFRSPQQIKQIAIKLLEILVYLQKQNPPIIHGNIKPENILVDEKQELQVYLIDFGFARQISEEVTLSSTLKGTWGFMPPEQIFTQKFTEASDLYSLGATLICLLTGIKSTEIGELLNETNEFSFKHKLQLPKLSFQFINWLEKMVKPDQTNRYPDAATALATLYPINPEINSSFFLSWHLLPKHYLSLVASVAISATVVLVGLINYWTTKTTEIILPKDSSLSENKIPVSPQNLIEVPIFTVGTQRIEVLNSLGQPSNYRRAFWLNSQSFLYKDYIPGRVDLGYIYDINTDKIRQTEVFFAESEDIEVMEKTLKALLDRNLTTGQQEILKRVYKGQTKEGYLRTDNLEGMISRNNNGGIVIGIWEKGFHQRS